MSKDETIIVTGAGGMLGRALITALNNHGYDQVIGITRSVVDLTDASNVEKLFLEVRPTTVFHLASRVYGLGGNLDHQLDVFRENTTINLNVVESCRKAMVKKIIAAGTVAAYGYPYINIPLKEEDLLIGQPHDSEYCYSQTKRHLLYHLVASMKWGKIDYAYGALTNIYGPWDKFDIQSSHVVPSLIGKAFLAKQAGNKLHVWGDGSQIRDFLYVNDAAEALITLFEKGSGVYNISSGLGVAVSDLVNCIVDSIGLPSGIVWEKDKPVGIKSRIVDNSKLVSLGFCPDHSIADGISETITWLSANSSNIDFGEQR